MKSLLFVILQQQQANPWMTFLMFGLIIVVFYFFMIRPQMKRQKELRKFQESLAKGDKVIIAGGIYGKIVEIKEEYALVEIDTNATVKVIKSTIIRDASDIQTR
ncbi:MAG TPA: preprotein translocase subunit YajC [Tenuifilaceae bacterium]|nr:preprotein translocase subunit YajC [Tenuifilaceae bacterium]HOZ13741.1 preprotein translocase subunit YajC [Tenuifilaceae bacterium]HPI46462.1 preprotein translocase subunit YajC [Tenuifilaceae bacterium]HPN22558.1 preprotein translocase subunit YajC [Tenuifilaceae bacterium]HPV56472.1 preprotein translocase subunit YajC [Tenuifilaceae bacterium]